MAGQSESQSERQREQQGERAGDRVRVGHISFLNCLPIYWGLNRLGALDDVDLVRDTPDRLSDALVAGELDAGPISVVEYLRHPEDLVLLPDLAVGSDGPVMSVNLVSRRPLDQLDGRPVVRGSTSRTSILLAQLLLEQRWGVRPSWSTAPADLPSMLANHDAAVLIGDDALRASLFEAAELGAVVHDLGEAWRDWTGLPMVFAVWAVRVDALRAHPEAVRRVHELLIASRDLSVERVGEVATDAARAHPFAAADLERYFATLDFELGDRQLAGLREFARRVAPLAGSDPEPDLRLMDV